MKENTTYDLWVSTKADGKNQWELGASFLDKISGCAGHYGPSFEIGTSNKIVKDLVSRLEEHCKTKNKEDEFTTNYQVGKNGRISIAEFKNKLGTIEGKISHFSARYAEEHCGPSAARIVASARLNTSKDDMGSAEFKELRSKFYL